MRIENAFGHSRDGSGAACSPSIKAATDVGVPGRPPHGLRSLLYAGLIATAAALAAPAASAQEWPTRPVRIIVPFGPGGVTDIQARLTADRLSHIFRQPFVIENKPTGAGVVAAREIVRAEPDGHTLYFVGASMFFTLPMTQKVDLDYWKRLTPISIVGSNALGFGTNLKLPVKSFREFLDYARAHPGKLNFAIGGAGLAPLAGVALAKSQGLDLVGVPFGNGPSAVTALLSGHADVYYGNLSDLIDHARNSKVRLLAVSSDQRLPQLPDTPTIAETVPGYSMVIWNGYFAPTGTPPAVIKRLSDALGNISREPEIRQKLDSFGITALGTSSAEMEAIIERDRPTFRAALEASKP